MKVTDNGRSFSQVLESYLRQREIVKRANNDWGQDHNKQAHLKTQEGYLKRIAAELDSFFK